MTTDTITKGYTYTATVREGDGFSMARGGKFIKTITGVVLRSDGSDAKPVTVFTGDVYSNDRGTGRKAAQGQANMQVGRFRRYLAAKGVCWYDRRQERLTWEKAQKKCRIDTSRELMDAVSAGSKATMEDVCPFPRGTSHAIVWTEARARTTNQLRKWDAENPQPPHE